MFNSQNYQINLSGLRILELWMLSTTPSNASTCIHASSFVEMFSRHVHSEVDDRLILVTVLLPLVMLHGVCVASSAGPPQSIQELLFKYDA